jgi:hypothetical protein
MYISEFDPEATDNGAIVQLTFYVSNLSLHYIMFCILVRCNPLSSQNLLNYDFAVGFGFGTCPMLSCNMRDVLQGCRLSSCYRGLLDAPSWRTHCAGPQTLANCFSYSSAGQRPSPFSWVHECLHGNIFRFYVDTETKLPALSYPPNLQIRTNTRITFNQLNR